MLIIIAVTITFLLLLFTLNFCKFGELCLFNDPPQQIYASFFYLSYSSLILQNLIFYFKHFYVNMYVMKAISYNKKREPLVFLS